MNEAHEIVSSRAAQVASDTKEGYLPPSHSWKSLSWLVGTKIPVSLSNQRQHRTLHIQKDVLPYALC